MRQCKLVLNVRTSMPPLLPHVPYSLMNCHIRTACAACELYTCATAGSLLQLVLGAGGRSLQSSTAHFLSYVFRLFNWLGSGRVEGACA